jgi:signal transduction histidine kinase
LESNVRQAIARILYLGIAAFVLSLVLGGVLIAIDAPETLREPAPLFLLASVCALLIEALRGRTLGALEALLAPQLQRLRYVREEFERSAQGRWDGDEIARLLAAALDRGIAPRSGCILLAAAGSSRIVHAFGRDPLETVAVDEALRLLGSQSTLHLAASSSLQEEAPALVNSGVEVVIAIEGGGERHGVLLLGGRERKGPFTGMELEFAMSLAAHAGIALRNAQITAGLIASERHAATGRVAIGLAHDVGKDLGWMRRLVKRLPDKFDDPERLARDASMIHELTGGLADAIERFVRDATEPCDASAAARPLEELVDDAVRRAARLHGDGRVDLNLDRGLRDLRIHQSFGRAVWNLLDNALHASPDTEPVHVIATREGESIRIEIADQGGGIDESLLGRIFEPGFTTRSSAGGSGVGLPVALEIVESLGGTLELHTGMQGTRARIRVPATR